MLEMDLLNSVSNAVESMVKTSQPPSVRLLEHAYLVCARCRCVTYRVCTSLQAYQFYVFTRRRYRDFICVKCCGDIPRRVIGGMFGGRGEEVLEELREEQEMFRRIYEQWYAEGQLSKHHYDRKEEMYKWDDYMKEEEEEQEERIDWKVKGVNEIDEEEEEEEEDEDEEEEEDEEEHEKALSQSLCSIAETSFKNYIFLQQRYKDLQKEVSVISLSLESTRRELARKEKVNNINMQRIEYLENHQHILREYIQDQKKIMCLRTRDEKKDEDIGLERTESQTRYVRPDAYLKSFANRTASKAEKCAQTDAYQGADDGSLKREIAFLDACINELNSQVARHQTADKEDKTRATDAEDDATPTSETITPSICTSRHVDDATFTTDNAKREVVDVDDTEFEVEDIEEDSFVMSVIGTESNSVEQVRKNTSLRIHDKLIDGRRSTDSENDCSADSGIKIIDSSHHVEDSENTSADSDDNSSVYSEECNTTDSDCLSSNVGEEGVNVLKKDELTVEERMCHHLEFEEKLVHRCDELCVKVQKKSISDQQQQQQQQTLQQHHEQHHEIHHSDYYTDDCENEQSITDENIAPKRNWCI